MVYHNFNICINMYWILYNDEKILIAANNHTNDYWIFWVFDLIIIGSYDICYLI